MVAVIEQVPEALVTERTVPANEHPVEAPAEKATAPVPFPPVVDRVEVVPYVTEEGVETAVKVA